jgi:hypothetical protein
MYGFQTIYLNVAACAYMYGFQTIYVAACAYMYVFQTSIMLLWIPDYDMTSDTSNLDISTIWATICGYPHQNFIKLKLMVLITF